MQKQLEALFEINQWLAKRQFQHVVIGGIANAIWGQPRATLDADFKVLLGEVSLADFIDQLGQSFTFRVSQPLAFAQKTYVVPLYATNQIGIDLSLGFLGYETIAIQRAITVEYEGVRFPVCTAEDLVIHKAISERDKDWMDIEGVLIRQGQQLDYAYIFTWLEQFAEALDRPELLNRLKKLRTDTEQKGDVE